MSHRDGRSFAAGAIASEKDKLEAAQADGLIEILRLSLSLIFQQPGGEKRSVKCAKIGCPLFPQASDPHCIV